MIKEKLFAEQKLIEQSDMIFGCWRNILFEKFSPNNNISLYKILYEVPLVENSVKLNLDEFENLMIEFLKNFQGFVNSKRTKRIINKIILLYIELFKSNKRWENIEKYIIKDFDLAILYVKQVLCENWVDLEEKLIERRKARKIYSYFFATKKCKLPEILHNFMLAKSIENNKHAIKYIKELSHGNV